MSGTPTITRTHGKAVGVSIDNVSKAFGEQVVLDKVSFDVNPGEIFVLMGPSGSGKSVLLKHVVGLLSPDSGRVAIDGKDAGDCKTRHDVVTALVFQAGALFNSLTVFDNLALYPREHRLYGGSQLEQKVMHTLKMLSLEEAAKKTPAELSGGMRKRVAIARALMMEPQLILYDEPTSELDPTTAAVISEIIGTLKEEFEVTSIVVSHDRDLAFSIGERVAVLMNGRIQEIGSPEELKASKDPAVNDFLYPAIDIKNPRFRQKT